MSIQITTAMVNQFSANVFHLSQQKGSRLRGLVRTESQKAEAAFHDRIGSVDPQKKVGRHSDTTYQDTPHSRRKITLEDYFFADLVDKEDKIRILQSPESEYTKAAMMSLGRGMDDELIAAAVGSSYAGKAGGTPVVLPNGQKIGAFAGDGTSTVGSKLNVPTLRATKKVFNQNETGESDLNFCFDSEQLDALLGETEVTSSDYAAVKALVMGDVDTFMGFKFVRSERLLVTAASTAASPTDGSVGAGLNVIPAGSTRCFAWQKEGLLLAIGQDMQAKLDIMPSKHYAVQVYASMGIGATRLEEEKVVEVICI